MSQMLRLDDESRAEMLCYLVIGELVAMTRTGEWLRTDHLVESAHIWMKARGALCDWQERVALARTAAELAPKVLASFQLAAEHSPAPLFVDGWMLDYRSPIVCNVHQVCAARLSHR